MRRREFITLLGGTAATWPFAVRAQQNNHRIGVIIGYAESDPETRARLEAFRRGRRNADGRKITIFTSTIASRRVTQPKFRLWHRR